MCVIITPFPHECNMESFLFGSMKAICSDRMKNDMCHTEKVRLQGKERVECS